MEMRDLYPEFSEEELKEAEERLDAYLALALKIFLRSQEKQKSHPQPEGLTSAQLELGLKSVSAEDVSSLGKRSSAEHNSNAE